MWVLYVVIKGGLHCSRESDGPAGARETKLGPNGKWKDTEHFSYMQFHFIECIF